MSNQTNIIGLIKSISGQANVLTIPRLYLDLLNNNHRAALLLSQSVYWSDRTKAADGWFYKTDSDWREEIGLPRGALETALKATEKYIEQEVRRVGPTPKTHYRVKLDLLVSDISEMLESSKSDLLENGESTYAETTTETTIAPKPHGRARTPDEIERKALQDSFSALTGIPFIEPHSQKEIKATAQAWYQPIRQIMTACNGSSLRVMETAIQRMRKDGLTLSCPRSVVSTCLSVYGELQTAPASKYKDIT